MATEATEVNGTETTDVSVSNNDDLFGPSDGRGEISEPEQSTGEETPSDSEVEPVTDEGEAEQDVAAGEGEDEEATVELPTQQAKSYSDELTAEYARRFGWSIDDLRSDKSKAYAVKKSIDSDIYLAQLKAQLDSAAATDAEEEEESQAEPSATEAEGNAPNAQYEQFISQAAERFISPAAAEKHGRAIAIAMLGTDPDKIQNPEQRAEAEAFVKRGSAIAKSSLTAFIDLMETYVPQRMEAYMEAFAPGFAMERAANESRSIWNEMRASNPDFAVFPEYGPQDGKFGEFIRAHAAKIPNFDGMVINDPKTGRPLPRAQQVAAKYQLIAMAASSGKRPTTQMVKQAAETARRQAEEQTARKQAAKSLGAGNSKANFSQKPSGNDDIFGSVGEFTGRKIGY